MFTKKKKQAVIAKNRVHDTDTGSANVQVAILEERIKHLSEHLKKNRKDLHSRRGLLTLVSKRRSHTKYLEKKQAKAAAKKAA